MRNEHEREETSAATKLTYLLVGGGIGAVLALLFAPKSGEELRGDIADVTRKGMEKGKEAAGQLQDKAGDYYEVSREKAAELYQTSRSVLHGHVCCICCSVSTWPLWHVYAHAMYVYLRP